MLVEFQTQIVVDGREFQRGDITDASLLPEGSLRSLLRQNRVRELTEKETEAHEKQEENLRGDLAKARQQNGAIKNELGVAAAAIKERDERIAELDAEVASLKERIAELEGEDDTDVETPIETLGLDKGIVNDLKAAGIETVEALQRYIVASDKQLTDISGIGDKSAASILEALDELES